MNAKSMPLQQAKAPPKTEVERLREELANWQNWRNWGVVEIMVRNPSVAEFVRDKEAEIKRLHAAVRAALGSLDDPTGGQHVADMRRAAAILREVIP